MKKRFDASLKFLLEEHPGHLLAFLLRQLGRKRPARVKVVETDLSTVTAAADKVFLIQGRRPWLLHLEVQVGHDHRLPRRVLQYNVLLTFRFGLPVCSVILLLHPGADRGSLTGELRYQVDDLGEEPYLAFRYHVVRLWQLPVEALLAGGLGLLPLAPLADVRREELPYVIERMKTVVDREATPGEADDLWTAANVLLGLRYPRDLVSQLLRGVRPMEESSTYRAIRAEGAYKMLLHQGTKRLGPPDAATRSALEAIDDLDFLIKMSDRIPEVSSWAELLATPRPRRRRRRTEETP
jgi:predicted transposase YdaD